MKKLMKNRAVQVALLVAVVVFGVVYTMYTLSNLSTIHSVNPVMVKLVRRLTIVLILWIKADRIPEVSINLSKQEEATPSDETH